MRWLAHEPPNLEKAKQLIDRIISDGKRAADIVSRIRDFSKRRRRGRESLEINEAILGVIRELTRGEISKNRVLVTDTCWPKDLPLVHGGWVQLQQVILNLIVNALEALSQIERRSP